MRFVFGAKVRFSYHISIFLLLWCLPKISKAQDTLFITHSFHRSSEINLRKVEDVSCSKKASEVNFKDTQIAFEKTNHCYWSELILKNLTENNVFVLEIRDPHFGYIEVFQKIGNDYKKLTKSGFSINFLERDIHHKNHITLVEIPKNQSIALYLKTNTQVEAESLVQIKPIKEFINYSLSEYIILGVFYGILILLLIYNFVLYFTNKKKYYLWYIFYILCCCINTFNENGLGFQYIWPNSPLLNYFFYQTGALWLGLSFLFYSTSFLGEKILKIKTTIYLSVILICTHFIFTIDAIERYWAIPYIIFFAFILYRSTSKFKQLLNPFSYFTVGNSFLFLSFLVLFLRILGIMPNFWLTVYFFNFGFVIEGVVFSYAMAHRLNKAHEKLEESQLKIIEELKEKELLKDKVNRELEEKVQERTVLVESQKLELVALNNELKEYHKKIDYINSELDKDNYKLKKSLNEAKKDKILKRIVSFEEFGDVFKTDNYCLKHLVELKWADGFKCKKCKGKSFSLVAKTHNRKCTTCKHIESPTANTIFHGIKFPLNKAFYLVYLTHYSKKEFTIDELSIEMDLRRNTLWAFRKKVIERKEELLKANKIVVNSPWERLIID